MNPSSHFAYIESERSFYDPFPPAKKIEMILPTPSFALTPYEASRPGLSLLNAPLIFFPSRRFFRCTKSPSQARYPDYRAPPSQADFPLRLTAPPLWPLSCTPPPVRPYVNHTFFLGNWSARSPLLRLAIVPTDLLFLNEVEAEISFNNSSVFPLR